MSHKFPTISVTKLFVSIDPRPATEEERWMGLPAIVPGYRPSGNTFINHFMPLLHAGGALPVEYYAKELERLRFKRCNKGAGRYVGREVYRRLFAGDGQIHAGA